MTTPSPVLTVGQADTIRRLWKAGMSQREIAVRVGVSRQAVAKRISRHGWPGIDDPRPSVPASPPPVPELAPSWTSRGACVGHEPAAWEDERNPTIAREVCHTCPVIADCLEYALTAREAGGIWGGKTPDERTAIRRARRQRRDAS